MIDESLFEDGNGGQLIIRQNDIHITDQIYTQVYILMFGGNVEASTTGNENADSKKEGWWGNNVDKNSDDWINSETERALIGSDTTPRSLKFIKQAVEKDLEVLSEEYEIDVQVTYPSLNRVKITIELNKNEELKTLAFIWNAAEEIEEIIL